MGGCNFEIRQFEDELNELVDSHTELNLEEKLLCLQITAFKVSKLADAAIIQELEDASCKKPIQE